MSAIDCLIPNFISVRDFDSSLLYKDGEETASRETEYYEFSIYTTDGGFFRENGEVNRIVPGARRFTVPHTTVSGVGPYKCRTIRFTLDGTDEATLKLFLSRIPSFSVSPHPEVFDTVFDLLNARKEPYGPDTVFAERSALYLLLHLLVRETSENQNENASPVNVVNQLKYYIAKHYTEPISLNDLGHKAGYHPIYLHRIFKAQVGLSPLDYQKSIRLENAKNLLTTTNLPVSHIATAMGYSSVSYFQNLFRKDVGMTPLAYRKQSSILF